MSKSRQQKITQVLKNTHFELDLMLGLINEYKDPQYTIREIEHIIRRALKDIEKYL